MLFWLRQEDHELEARLNYVDPVSRSQREEFCGSLYILDMNLLSQV